MRRALLIAAFAFAAAAAAACGEDPPAAPDAAPAVDAADLPPDPFATMYDSPDDFPRGNCRAGALAGFSHTGYWPGFGIRIARENGELEVYGFYSHVEDRPIPHLWTDDDLLYRRSTYHGTAGWSLAAYDVCDVLADGTLIGSRVHCSDFGGSPACSPPAEVRTMPLRRAAGEGDGDGLTLLGEVALEGAAVNVRVAGNVALLPMLDRGMRIVSVVNPAAPVKRGWWLPSERNYYNDVKLLERNGRRYAVLAGYPSDVVDVTDPAAPFLAASIPAGAHTLFIEGTLAYLAGGGETLIIVDLAVPTAPRVRARYRHPAVAAWSHDLHVTGGIAYVSVEDDGLAVIDCRNPDAPVSLGITERKAAEWRYWHSPWVTEVGGRTLVVHGDEGSGGKLEILDGDPASPTFLAGVGTWLPRGDVSLHNVMALGARAYVAHYQDGVRVLDLTDPSAPSLLAYYNTWREEDAIAAGFSGAFGLDLHPANRRIYVADSLRGLLVLEGSAAVFP